MTRPAIVIGLGGSGQWVLTYLKEYLMSTSPDGKVPREVKLVAFDTVTTTEAATPGASSTEAVASVNSVQLDPGEFIGLAGNTSKLTERVAEGQYPHIGSWYQARLYQSNLDRQDFDLHRGAAKMRPFGRMAIFYDMMNDRKVLGKLTSLTQELREFVSKETPIELIVVGSLAGGTGAGMFIDVAYLARSVAEQMVGENFNVRGILMLPGVFSGLPTGNTISQVRDMRSRAFAALRELSRMLTTVGERPYPMYYDSRDPQLRKELNTTLFKVCYLVDGQRNSNSLAAVEPRYGVYPAIADMLSVILDDEAGRRYTEYVTTNITPEILRLSQEQPGRAHISVLGIYTYYLPVQMLIDYCTHRLARDLLKHIGTPTFRDDKERQPTTLSAAANLEAANRPPETRDVQQFMAAPRIGDVATTSLFTTFNELIEQGGETNNKLVEDVAAWNRRWLQYLAPDAAGNEEIEILRRDIDFVLNAKVTDEVKTSAQRNTDPRNDWRRVVDDVAEFDRKYIGTVRTDGSTTGGQLRESLDRYLQIQLDRFRRRLEHQITTLLNGEDRDPLKARSGKLGYSAAFLDQLDIYLDNLTRLMRAVAKVRGRTRRVAEQQRRVADARGQMQQHATDRNLIGRPARAAGTSQTDYLAEEQQLFDRYVEEYTYEYVEHAVAEMRSIVQQARQEALRLGQFLILGDSAGSVKSLYTRLIENEDRLQQRRGNESAIKVRESLLSDSLIGEIYKRQLDRAGTIARLLDNMRWQVSLQPGRSWSLELNFEQEQQRRDASQIETLLSFARQPFLDVARDETAARVLRQIYVEAGLVRSMQEKSGLMTTLGTTDNMTPLPANFLQIQTRSSDDDQYFTVVKNQIGASSGARADHVQLLKSNNPFRCVILNTRDLVPIDALRTYEECKEAYLEVMAQSMVGEEGKNAQRLAHILPSEVKAVEYEARLINDLDQPYRPLNPSVITYLEYPERLRLFLQAWLADMVQIEPADRPEHFAYFLQLPLDNEGRMLDNPRRFQLTRLEENPDRLQFADAIDAFIFKGKDVRVDRPQQIDWPVLDLNVRRLLPADDADRLALFETARKTKLADLAKLSPRYRDLAALFELIVIDMKKTIIARSNLNTSR